MAGAKEDLLTNYKKLYIIPKDGKVWRLTTAGTPWVMMGWGYKESGAYYDLHVHGKVVGKNEYEMTSSDPKIRGNNMKYEAFLSGAEWALIRGTVKEVLKSGKTA